MCVCVCVCEAERERERERVAQLYLHIVFYVLIAFDRNAITPLQGTVIGTCCFFVFLSAQSYVSFIFPGLGSGFFFLLSVRSLTHDQPMENNLSLYGAKCIEHEFILLSHRFLLRNFMHLNRTRWTDSCERKVLNKNNNQGAIICVR